MKPKKPLTVIDQGYETQIFMSTTSRNSYAQSMYGGMNSRQYRRWFKRQERKGHALEMILPEVAL